MRVLWLSPWFRPRARIFAENLRKIDVEVMLVTSDRHFESDTARDYETILLGRPVPTKDWIRCLKAYRSASKFKPDLVVTESLLDPRWLALAGLAPRIRIVHDDKPHDETHVPDWWKRWYLTGGRWDIKAAATVVFCRHVAEGLQISQKVKPPLYVTPLTSDLEVASMPPFVSSELRRDFLLIGRQRPYKNHEVVFAAWEKHARGPAWRGDELVLFGDGTIPTPLPQHARWHAGTYRYRDMISVLAHGKGSVIHSRSASQSGVQLLSLSLGVPTLVSDAGGLPEYQPPGFSTTGIDDVRGLADGFDALADPAEVERQSMTAVAHYQSNYAPEKASASLACIFEEVLARADR